MSYAFTSSTVGPLNASAISRGRPQRDGVPGSVTFRVTRRIAEYACESEKEEFGNRSQVPALKHFQASSERRLARCQLRLSYTEIPEMNANQVFMAFLILALLLTLSA
ncbi:unnamed protein product [Schistocephalus solidus]|uniref:Uncharacterized protein n=1 Tax=Schistocephalus solidus TaxID=70667 RepID=A0A183SHD0_SCHSO|nr:unnamed protein product [Schistocephalus solidus]